jgi:hypothetical protein
MSPDLLNDYRIVPRLMVAGYGFELHQISMWFMSLQDPTGAQAAFVSTWVGASAAVFGLYTNSGNKQ